MSGKTPYQPHPTKTTKGGKVLEYRTCLGPGCLGQKGYYDTTDPKGHRRCPKCTARLKGVRYSTPTAGGTAGRKSVGDL